jgi:hypothetical protein
MEAQQIIISARKLYVYGILLIVSALALLIGFFVENSADGVIWREMLGHLLTEVGIAGFVGFILALTFEKLSAEEFRKLASDERDAIKQDVFHYVFGHSIPQEIMSIIDKQILKTPLVRRNLRVEYVLEAVEAPGGATKYVRATRELNYEVENLSGQPCRLPVTSAVDVAPIPELQDDAKFLYVRAEGCAQPFECGDESELRGMQRVSRIEKCISFEDKVVVLPDRPTSVTVRTQSVKHYDGGGVYFILNTHTCDLDLTVIVPGKDMEVEAAATTENELTATHRHKPQLGFYNWKLERPLLAYQGVDVRWFPKGSHVAAPAQAGAASGNGTTAAPPVAS